MPLLKRRTTREADIPTSSMADIAFLLLIFFLVTTTIDVDAGIYMQLPPKLTDEVPPEINQRNLLNVLVASDGTVLLDNEITNVGQIRQTVITHVTNEGRLPQFSVNPQDAVVSFKTERGLPYETYIRVLDEIKSGYNDIRNGYARQLAGVDYLTYRARLGEDDPDEVSARYPLKISLAEPDPD